MEELELKKFDMRRIKPTNICAFLAPRNSGKCLAKGTKVLMFDGSIKKIQDIKTGDVVMGDDSTPRNVLKTSNGIDIMYKVTHNGEDYIDYTVNSNHVLSFKTNISKKIKKTKDCYLIKWFKDLKIVNKKFTFTIENKNQVCKKALDFYRNIKEDIYVDIPIEKYISLPNEVRKNLHGYRKAVHFPYTPIKEDPFSHGYTNSKYSKKYIINSKKVRVELLKGIIKSYGDVHLDYIDIGFPCDLDSVSFLAGSLGYSVEKTNVKTIRLRNKKMTSGITVKKTGKGEYYGFELDGNHRFMLSNFIVTHNSFLIKDLLYYQQDIPAGMVVSKTDKLTNYYSKFIPSSLIHEEYTPELLDKLFDRQKKALRDNWKNPHAFLIFDDTLSDADNWKKDQRIKEIFYNGRHYKLLFLLTMQYPMGITPGLRCNIDYTFILRTPNQKNRKDLYDNYCGMFPSREIFEKVLDACTEDYGCIVIDNTTRSNKLEDQVFYYRADAHEDYKLCSKQFWEHKPRSVVQGSSNDTSFNLKGKRKFVVKKKIS